MELIGLLVILFLIVLPAFVIATFILFIRQRNVLRSAVRTIGELALRIEVLERRPAPPAPTRAAEPKAEPAPVVLYVPAVKAAPSDTSPAVDSTAALEPPVPEEPSAPEPALAPAPPPSRPTLEERLTSRWFLWVGAAALGLAGLFLVKYSIDNALLTPRARIGLGLLLGSALVGAGEWLRRRPAQRRIAALSTDHAPGALVSGGIFTLFASLLAAYRLYDLIGPGVAFAALAATAFAAFALSVLHGPIVAVIGLLAGFATPALVGAEEPSAWGLFSYLALVVAASLAVVWHRKWGWLAFGSLAGGVIWVVLWVLSAPQGADLLALTAFLAVLTAGMLWLALMETPAEEPDILRSAQELGLPQICAWLTVLLSSLLYAWAVWAGGHALSSIVLLGLILIAVSLAGRWFERFDAMFIVAAGLVLLVFATFPVWPMIYEASREIMGADAPPYRGLLAPALAGYMTEVLIFACLLAGLGAWLLRGAVRPAVWAATSVVGTALLIAIAYWQLRTITQDLLWAGLAAASGVIAMGMVRLLNGHRDNRGYRLSLGVYAAAVVAAACFTLAFVLREAWFTVSLSLMLPALAWIEEKLDLREMRGFAFVVATVVLVRLVLNPYILDYSATAEGGAHWVLYGYGVPAVAFYLASRLFRRRGEDRVVIALEGGALVFALLLMSFELRILIAGRIDAPGISLFEASLHSAVWFVAGWWRGRAYVVSGRPFDRWASAVLISLALAGVVFVQLFAANPLFTNDSVGGWRVFDALLPGYLLPGLLIFLVLRDVRLGAPDWLRQTGAGGALFLMLLWLTLETRHWFLGERIGLWQGWSDAEFYAYSAVWLLAAFVLLGLGVLFRQPILRHGALAIMVAAVFKVFIFDLADLTGLYRVASLLGLGLSLVAIGLLYQRFVFPSRAPAVTPDPGVAVGG